MFGANDTSPEPCTGTEFRRQLEQYDGDSYREEIGTVVDAVWPAPGYREHQRETVIDIIEQFYVEDKDVVLLNSPTGSGKSLLLYATSAVVNEVVGRKSFNSTPLNTLLDQIENDDLMDDIITVKGRNNYECVHPRDAGAPVDKAVCQRDDDFECQYKQRMSISNGCPYYSRKNVAKNKPFVYTNLSFLMANSLMPDAVDAGFDNRGLLTVDECQGVDDFALLFVGFTVSENNVPINWDNVASMPSEDDSMDETIEWLEEELLAEVTARINDLESRKEGFAFTQKEQDDLDELNRFVHKVTNFIEDAKENHWAKTHSSYGGEKIEFEPIKVGRFMDQYLWSQSNKVLCASATIPPSFTEEVGLGSSEGGCDVGRVEVESTFPAERRPIITTESVGKMSYHERDTTLPKMADQIGTIADIWEGAKGFVHCNSYDIADKIYQRLPDDVQRRTRLQDDEERTGSLEDWMEASVEETGQYRDEGGQVFLSVAMEEGISLDDDLARWQVIAKASYPHMKDERVDYRMDKDTMGGAEWNWYNSQAVIDLQQAAGRAVRSKDDWAATYVLDDSAVQLIERNAYLFEDWFLDAVDCDFDEQCVAPSNASDPNPDNVQRKSGNESLDEIADDYF